MEQIICLQSLISIRKEPNHRSELVSQLIFGERAAVIDKLNDWLFIETLFDHYKGWIEDYVVKRTFIASDEKPEIIVREPIITINFNGVLTYLPAGSELTSDQTSHSTNIEEKRILNTGINTTISETAKKFLNSPYLWGGRTCFGFDCSGFTQVVFKIHEIILPRDAKDQAIVGEEINKIENAKVNDLVFFGESKDQITHVGILLKDNKIIHASKTVRIDNLDTKGIYNEGRACYTHTLQAIRRVV